ncbi:MAG: endonuclease VIII, partial [Nannocystaceae bacterium]
MPEGPEIRRAADRVAKAVVGHPLREVTFAFEHLQPFEAPLTTSQVTEVGTRGKAMLTRFACGLTVYSHNQLYGRWMIGASDSPPRTGRSLRFAIVGPRRAARLYSASEIDVIVTDDVDDDPRVARLGPDALDPEVTVEQVAERLRSRTFGGRQLAALLLDQGFVAGLGNYLRSDILLAAKIHPRRRPRELDPDQQRRLADRILVLTRQSYRTGGITNDAELEAAIVAIARERGTGKTLCPSEAAKAVRP